MERQQEHPFARMYHMYAVDTRSHPGTPPPPPNKHFYFQQVINQAQRSCRAFCFHVFGSRLIIFVFRLH